MMPGMLGRWFGRWAAPIGAPQLGTLSTVLGVAALLVRLYAGIAFVQYGYDKLLGGNRVYAMDADFFRTLGIPFPEVTQVLIGLLELFGGLALIVGLLTRLFAFLLAGNMLVAMLTFGNTAAELPLFLCCAGLVALGGGLLSVDQLIDRRFARPAAAPALATPTRRTGV